MTNEKINIAIAQACGWTQSSTHEYTLYGLRNIGEFQQFETRCAAFEKNGVLCDVRGLPNYCNDLNAMHEAENRFISDASSAMTYAMLLLRVRGLAVVSEYDELNFDYCWHACHANARQRAEAFLKTVGKWEE